MDNTRKTTQNTTKKKEKGKKEQPIRILGLPCRRKHKERIEITQFCGQITGRLSILLKSPC